MHLDRVSTQRKLAPLSQLQNGRRSSLWRQRRAPPFPILRLGSRKFRYERRQSEHVLFCRTIEVERETEFMEEYRKVGEFTSILPYFKFRRVIVATLKVVTTIILRMRERMRIYSHLKTIRNTLLEFSWQIWISPWSNLNNNKSLSNSSQFNYNVDKSLFKRPFRSRENQLDPKRNYKINVIFLL